MIQRLQQSITSHKLATVIAIAVIVRVVALVVFSGILDFERPGSAIQGSEAYDNYAVNLLETGVYGSEPGEADADIPPLYSYVLAVVYGIFGRGFVQVGLFHIVLDAIAIALLYDIARRLLPQGEWVGVVAGLCYALYPYLIFQNLTLIDTPLYMVSLHAFVLLMIMLRQQPSLNRKTWLIAVGGGLILGLGMLVRPITAPLAVFVALWFIFRLSLWQSVVRLLPVALVSVLALVPWIIRNYGLYDAFVPMTTTSGANFWQGNSEWTIPVFQAGYDVQWTAPDTVAPRDSREADAERFSMAFDYLRNNPDRLLELWWTKFLVHWSIGIAPRYNPQEGERFGLDENGEFMIVRGETVAGVTPANTAYDSGLLNTVGRPLHSFYFGGLLLLALIGIGLTVKQWREVSLLWFVQISMTLVYVAFHPSTRYRVPSDPLLFIFSAVTVVWLIQRWYTRRTTGKR